MRAATTGVRKILSKSGAGGELRKQQEDSNPDSGMGQSILSFGFSLAKC